MGKRLPLGLTTKFTPGFHRLGGAFGVNDIIHSITVYACVHTHMLTQLAVKVQPLAPGRCSAPWMNQREWFSQAPTVCQAPLHMGSPKLHCEVRLLRIRKLRGATPTWYRERPRARTQESGSSSLPGLGKALSPPSLSFPVSIWQGRLPLASCVGRARHRRYKTWLTAGP